MSDSLLGCLVEATSEPIRGVVTHEAGDIVVIDGRWEIARCRVRVITRTDEEAAE